MLSETDKGVKQKKKKYLIDTDNSMVITRGKGGWGQIEEGKGRVNGDVDQILGGEHTIQDTGDVLQNCTLDTYIIL